MVSAEMLALALFVWARNVGIGAGNTDVPAGLWLAFGLFFLALAYSTWNLVKEAKAARLRHKRGLPTPAE